MLTAKQMMKELTKCPNEWALLNPLLAVTYSAESMTD